MDLVLAGGVGGGGAVAELGVEEEDEGEGEHDGEHADHDGQAGLEIGDGVRRVRYVRLCAVEGSLGGGGSEEEEKEEEEQWRNFHARK